MRATIHFIQIILIFHGFFAQIDGQARPGGHDPPSNPPASAAPSPPTSDPTGKPSPEKWVKEGRDRLLLKWLIDGNDDTPKQPKDVEYEGYDGFYNNIAHPTLGAVDTPLLRRVPAVYEDSVYKLVTDRPNPLDLSEKLMKGDIGTKSRSGKTALLVFFGQQVVEEILDAQRPACPPEYINIEIPKNHPYKDHLKLPVMPVLRTRYDMRTGFSPNNPRQQLNEITPWLDGGLTYGTTKTWVDQLRKYENGTLRSGGLLASSYNDSFPAINTVRLPMANPPPPFHHSMYIKEHQTANISRFFKLGNPRGNENPFLLTFGILWFRWHNAVARYLGLKNPSWDGEKIFNEARKWVIATHQHIVVNTWLPTWLGKELPPYKGYNPSIDPQIDQLFQSAAFRFGHTLVTPGVYLRDYGRNGCKTLKHDKFHSVRTCQHFWRPQDSILDKSTGSIVDIDRLLMGMASQLTEEEDNKIVEDLRGRVFGPLEFSRRDLMALNIQRGRDHGLPDYNTAREAFNLPRVKDFSHFPNTTNTPEIRNAFLELYNNSWDNIDVWVGGLLETTDGPGELFTKIIEDQFQRVRDGDRFWYANENNKLFSKEEIKRLESLTIYDIIMVVTQLDYNDIQPDPFLAPTKQNDIHSNCSELIKQDNCKRKGADVLCFHLDQLNATTVENCSLPGTYDYFSNSEVSFIATFTILGLLILACLGVMLGAANLKQKRRIQSLQKSSARIKQASGSTQTFMVSEWVGRKSTMRTIIIQLNEQRKQVQISNPQGTLLRAIDLSRAQRLEIFIINDGLHLMLRISNDYDLVIKFPTEYLKNNFLESVERFCDVTHVQRERRTSFSLKAVLNQAITREARQKRLDMFFRVVFSQAFKIQHSEDEILSVDSAVAREVIYTELTINEFAEALSMRPDSEFVKRMFDLVDKDRNGFVSFREFVDMSIIFAKGTADDKMKLMFDMYDINGTGNLTRDDFRNMLRSLMETVNADVEQQNLDQVIDSMMRQAGLDGKAEMRVQDFQRLFMEHKEKLGYTQLNFKSPTSPTSQTLLDNARRTAFSLYGDPREILQEERERQAQEESNAATPDEELTKKEVSTDTNKSWYLAIVRLIDNYTLQIFWVTLYTLVLLAIFAERAYYYSVEREHSGLRRIAGYGVTVTRGAASAMMFTYSSLLITMCRNTVTILRDTFLHMYFPFDSMVFMHKYIACWALIFTVMHTIGHAFNFYSISTQTSDDLTCLFRNYFHATHEIPKFHYWCWQTITGLTGVLLVIITAIIYIFALPTARTLLHKAFWTTHSLFPIFYILMFLHGAGRLIQEPFLHYFFLGPFVLFTLDYLITITRKKVEVPVVRAELLPSDVTFLEFKKPSNFEYKSGQWIRIACPSLNTNEYHPFTISSAPHEDNVTLHIRAVGPWTTNIRSLYDPNVLENKPLPKIHLEGPYGEGHQDWYKYEVAILVGGGIGVTPFASILKDLVFRINIKQSAAFKKVYFIWVTKTQRHFEWLVDIIREVEKIDERRVVSTHIFITQFYQKFDLRTVLLYICERHFQRFSNRSLFTGLKAVTHFGRPDFLQILKSVQKQNRKVRNIGVFSCGPPPMTRGVDNACIRLNQETEEGPVFQHHSKNF